VRWFGWSVSEHVFVVCLRCSSFLIQVKGAWLELPYTPMPIRKADSYCRLRPASHELAVQHVWDASRPRCFDFIKDGAAE